MLLSLEAKGGEKDTPTEMHLLKALVVFLLFPVAMAIQGIIFLLALLLNFVQWDTTHIVVKVIPKVMRMPDGTLRDPLSGTGHDRV